MDASGSEPERQRRPPVSSTDGAAPATSAVESAFDWCFRDRRTGHIVIAQFPNVALGVFVVTVVVRWFLAERTTAFTVAAWVGAAALGWWAVDEVVRGVNPWRRCLGAAVLVYELGTILLP